MKCEHWIKGDCGDFSMCPNNTDDSCNIIPRKKSKPKYRKVKAWARLPIGDNMIKYIEEVAFFKGEQGCYTPCTITIAERYLEGRTK